MIVDTLETFASVFKISIHPKRKYEEEVKHRPSIPNNVRHWQVFEDDKQIERFLQIAREFENTHIDEQNFFQE